MEPPVPLSIGGHQKDILYSFFLVMPERQLKILALVNQRFQQMVASFRYDYTLRPLMVLKRVLTNNTPVYPEYPPKSMASVDRAICDLKKDLLPALLHPENRGLRVALAESGSAVLRNLAIGSEYVVQYPCGTSLETTKLQIIGLLRFRQFPYLETVNLILSRKNYLFGTPRRCRRFLLTVMVNYAHTGQISAALEILKKVHSGTEIPSIYIKAIIKAYLLRHQYDEVIQLIQNENDPQRRKDLNDFVVRMLILQGLMERAHFFQSGVYATGGTVQKPFSNIGPALPIGSVPLK